MNITRISGKGAYGCFPVLLFIELCDNRPWRAIFNANMVPHKITPSLCDQAGFMKKSYQTAYDEWNIITMYYDRAFNKIDWLVSTSSIDIFKRCSKSRHLTWV